MNLTLVRPTADPTATATAAAVPRLAQVNLLPPEIRARRALTALSRWLVGGLAVLALALAGGFVAATQQVDAARADLETAQAQTARLTSEQLTYAEVPTVLGQVAGLRQARTQGLATEVPWSPYLGAVLAVLPDGVEVTSVDVTGATPMLAAAPALDPLQAPSLGRIALTGRSATVPDTASWVDGLNAIPGLSDAWVSSAALGSDEAHGPHYVISASVQVTDAALAHRFDATEGS